MLTQSVITAAYANRTAADSLETGSWNVLLAQVTGVAGGTAAENEAAAQLILGAMELNAVRSHRDGSSTNIITDVYADEFRRRANQKGGFMNALQGAWVVLGLQQLGGGEKLDLRADWRNVDETAFAASVDVAGAAVEITAVQLLADVPRVAYVYASSAQTREERVHPIEVPNITEAFYAGSGFIKRQLSVGGRTVTTEAAVLEAASAIQSRHEDENAAPLTQVYEAAPQVATSVEPVIKLYADNTDGRVIQVGFLA